MTEATSTASIVTATSAPQAFAPGQPLLTLAEAARRLPRINGKKVCVSTIWRWCRRGLRGVSLEHVRVGRKICTTHEALMVFFARLSELDKRIPPDTTSQPRVLRRRPITSRQRQRALAEADAILGRAGI